MLQRHRRELNEDDPDRRLQFCETMMNLCQTNPITPVNTCCDEATFSLNGTYILNIRRINVWAGIVANRIIGPFFFEETLIGEIYLEFLQNDLVPALAIGTIYFPLPVGQGGDVRPSDIGRESDIAALGLSYNIIGNGQKALLLQTCHIVRKVLG
ncbi:hypothetical protein NQ318_023657 [Aromia moschata]|uniref:Uncharacterized protein n=1 Tax=Aromia moschata TaxID=1265417 RepID=A0AAV8XRM2_9CUCU|nr:hypothetical protein NQ318_023657 [Aromia moschata]